MGTYDSVWPHEVSSQLTKFHTELFTSRFNCFLEYFVVFRGDFTLDMISLQISLKGMFCLTACCASTSYTSNKQYASNAETVANVVINIVSIHNITMLLSSGHYSQYSMGRHKVKQFVWHAKYI